jgi:hypothetical protein
MEIDQNAEAVLACFVYRLLDSGPSSLKDIGKVLKVCALDDIGNCGHQMVVSDL